MGVRSAQDKLARHALFAYEPMAYPHLSSQEMHMFSPDKVTQQHAIILDFDGTLVDLAETPSSVEVPVQLSPLLGQIYELLDGALAIVSGRPVAEIEGFLHLPKDMQVAGVHGAEWRGQPARSDDSLQSMLRRLEADAIRKFGAGAVERKSFAIAVHYRAQPQIRDAILVFLQDWLEGQSELRLIAGKAVFEVKPSWANKGAAVEALLARPPFHHRKAIMFGDDVTDEDAFAAVSGLGGIAVKIGQGPSIAPQRMASPGELRDWLNAAKNTLMQLNAGRTKT